MSSTEHGQLAQVAELLGELLLYEVDQAQAQRLAEPELRDGLGALGLRLPEGLAEDAAARDELAADYCRAMLQPEDGSGPLVQSLHEEGSYEGRAVAAIRQFAGGLGMEFDRESARHVPPDHLGCELLLWVRLQGRDEALARDFARAHLAWARRPLRTRANGPGFYGDLAKVTAEFLELLIQDPNPPVDR